MNVQQSRRRPCRGTCPWQHARVPLLAAIGSMLLFVSWTASVHANEIYSETFDSLSIPSNWFAQNGSNGPAFIEIADDSAGIGGGNALSINAFTRQGVIGGFDEVNIENAGDSIQLSFDVRLLSYPNNAGGFRFGLYHDNDGLELSSGYRIFVGTGTNAPRTDVAADGGDPDIMFGTNRENPPGFMNFINGISNNEPHNFVLNLTRTGEGVLIDVLQNGVASFSAPVLHVPGTGAGPATPLQTSFNQIAFSTNGGIAGFVDNVSVSFAQNGLPVLEGDYNLDGFVDGADFLVWQRGNSPNGLTASDLQKWQNNFGVGSQPPPPPRPEPPPRGTVLYSQTFDGPSVPANWYAQNGSNGPAFLSIMDDSSGIGSGNALSINSFTRQGVIGEFDDVSLENVGDMIQLRFDVRLESFPNNSGGFRFGLYHDNDGLIPSSGYRVLVGTGNNSPRTDVQADGGDDVNGDIGFGVNRENPPGFIHTLNGIDNSDTHSVILSLTRTTEGMLINVFQNGESSLTASVEHIPGAGEGVTTPLQTVFNQIMFTTNGGIEGLIDNVTIEFIAGTAQANLVAVPEPGTGILTIMALLGFAARYRRRPCVQR